MTHIPISPVCGVECRQMTEAQGERVPQGAGQGAGRARWARVHCEAHGPPRVRQRAAHARPDTWSRSELALSCAGGWQAERLARAPQGAAWRSAGELAAEICVPPAASGPGHRMPLPTTTTATFSTLPSTLCVDWFARMSGVAGRRGVVLCPSSGIDVCIGPLPSPAASCTGAARPGRLPAPFPPTSHLTSPQPQPHRRRSAGASPCLPQRARWSSLRAAARPDLRRHTDAVPRRAQPPAAMVWLG